MVNNALAAKPLFSADWQALQDPRRNSEGPEAGKWKLQALKMTAKDDLLFIQELHSRPHYFFLPSRRKPKPSL